MELDQDSEMQGIPYYVLQGGIGSENMVGQNGIGLSDGSKQSIL